MEGYLGSRRVLRLPGSPICLMGQLLLHMSAGKTKVINVKNGNVLLYKKVKCSSPGVFLDISERHMSFRNGIIES